MTEEAQLAPTAVEIEPQTSDKVRFEVATSKRTGRPEAQRVQFYSWLILVWSRFWVHFPAPGGRFEFRPSARLLAKHKALASVEERQRVLFDVDRLKAYTIGIQRRETRLGRLIGFQDAAGDRSDPNRAGLTRGTRLHGAPKNERRGVARGCIEITAYVRLRAAIEAAVCARKRSAL